MKVIPTILTDDIKKLKDKLHRLQNITHHIQIDCLDGKFVNNKTVPISLLSQIEDVNQFQIDLHLMVKKPIQLIEQIKLIKINRLIAHLEELQNESLFIQSVLKKGIKPGLALDLDSPVSLINKKNLKKIDIILLLAVKAGFSGQKFNSKVLEKIKKLRRLKQEEKFNFEICVDGGINFKTAKACYLAGADSIAVGSFFWKQNNLKETFLSLQ